MQCEPRCVGINFNGNDWIEGLESFNVATLPYVGRTGRTLRGFHSDIIEYSGGLGCDVVLRAQRSKLHELLKTEEISSFETPGTRHPAIQRYILEERALRGLCFSSSVYSKKQK